MGRPGPRYGEPLFGRTRDLLPACLARRAGRSEHTRKSRERGLGALNDCVTGELGIEPTPLTFAMCRCDPLPGWSQRMRADGLANGTVNSRLAMARAHLRHAVDADPSLTSAWLVSRKVPTPPAPKGRRPVTVAGDLPAFLDAPERTRLGNRDRPIPIPPLTRHGDEGGRARWRHSGRPGGAERGAGTRAGSRQGALGAVHRPVRQGGRAPACLSGRLPWGRARPVDAAVLHRGPRRDARDVGTQRRAHRDEVRRRRPGGAFGHPAHLSPHGPQNPCDNALP